MRRTGIMHRVLALLLVMIMTVQLIPTGVFAFGELRAVDTEIKVDTLNTEDAINWPIKIYDYLSDGMLFEWNDSTHTSKLSDGNDTTDTNTAPYGGGTTAPVTVLGEDFTYDSRLNAYQSWNHDNNTSTTLQTQQLTYTAWNNGYDRSTTSTSYNSGTAPYYYRYSSYYYYNSSNHGYGNAYYFDKVNADDYDSPMYAHIYGDSGTTGHNLMASSFRYSQSTAGDARYMVLVYRSEGLYDEQLFRMRFTNDTSTFSGVKDALYQLPDSPDEWTYVVIDLYSLIGTKTDLKYVWFCFYKTLNTTTALSSSASSYAGFYDGNFLDLSHIGYFGDKAEAHNYGQACVAFDNDPGEYLRHSTGSFTATTTTVTPSVNLQENYLFSLNYRWKTANAYPAMFGTDEVSAQYTKTWYGMDFTTTSKDYGEFTNAYTSNTWWTWENGSSQTYKYTDANTGLTGSNSFTMDPIGVEQKTEGNGAMYVRLTADKASKILLSKFREDHTQKYETYVPLTSDINYMVLVYRTNNWDSADKYGLWAQGYEEATCDTAGHTWASNWKYAGLVADGTDWTTASNVNPQSFGTGDGWQYTIVPLMDTIKENDSDMQWITRTARTGLYLPAMAEGQSLDLAYVSYFKASQLSTAQAFGQAAVDYMNSDPVVTTSNVTKTWNSSRVWNAGNNKGFGMLYSTGGGNWEYTKNTTEGGVNDTDAYGYATWMIGYNTAQYSDNAFNTNRMDPMTGKVYEAAYTSTTSKVIDQEASGSSNYTYFINTYGSSNDGNTDNGNAFDTSVLDFDGYELLETIKENGVLTVGLLEGSLRSVKVDGTEYRVPVYRQEVVEYIAYLLAHALLIPQRDSNGNYNMNFISGAESTQFGGVDLNGDKQIGLIDLDGDPRNGNECNEASVDLATALRHCLGITLPFGQDVGSYSAAYGSDKEVAYKKTLGTYAETMEKQDLLLGKFADCRNHITTAMDAAYYMLSGLFIADSFNQKQDDYYYLNMPQAELEMDGRTGNAYVFDAGFTTGLTADDYTSITDDGTNKSAIKYSPVIIDKDTAGTGTIYMEGVTGKTQFNYSKSGTTYTTRFPFLPVTGATGDYEDGTWSYYFWDDAVRQYHTESSSYYQPNADASNFTSNRRNYNYVIASNGEFVYKETDNLFFDFEGDDDVYLFINGELVMDNGAAHSITGVTIDVNDYVERAREVMAELYKYGYTNDMSIDEFDEMIDAATLEEYVYTDGKITGTKTVTNTYTADQKANFKRWARLDLVDGEICKFDFYYMERHGWGANMRIVTNMHITDPALDVGKTAYQYGQEIEYGGVIDPTASLEYNFSLTNSGNQKLYNLTFKDDVLGVTLDPTNGLTVSSDLNGKYVLDGTGKSLEAKDLTATVSGYNAIGQYVEVPVTFPEVDGDNGQTALKNFLNSLNAEGTESGYDDSEVTHAGSGLWVDATVTIHGIHYMLTPEQTDAGTVHNTVYLTATTKINPSSVGNKTLYSDAEHIIYTSGFPVHYQWAGHNIFMKMGHLLTEAKEEANTAGTQLSLYQEFFKKATDLDSIWYALCDKYGRTGGVYPYHTKFTDKGNNPGYLINYDEPGVYTFYLLLYLKDNGEKQYLETGVNAEDIDDGDYAIIRSQVYVADVEDSIYVLDYGLSTESLDMGGELFKNDYLFGPYGTIRAKLMGVTGTEPRYLDPETVSDTDYCRIDFQAQNLKEGNTVKTNDGIFKVNLAIPDEGKLIGYDSTTGEYTLTGSGTVTITAKVPDDGNWEAPYLYYWYDGGVSGPAWPGTAMKPVVDANGIQIADTYELDIPADVNNIIINNGSAAFQTADLSITAGLEATITVNETTNSDGKYTAGIETIIHDVTLHAKVPSTWEKAYVHYWYDNDSSAGTTFPGEQMTEVDENGYYTFQIPGNVTNVIISDGANNQSGDQKIYAGKEVWIEVADTITDTVTNEDSTVTNYYNTVIKYTLSDGYVVHASVPNSWNDTVYIYYWHEGMTDDEMTWPGKPMTKGDFGWYTYDGLVPADVHQIIINDGNTNATNHQTVDLAITPGLETWVVVSNETANDGSGKYTATVAYGSESGSTGLTFTPKSFMDEANDMWLALTVHSTAANPYTLASKTIDIHNEVQMFKKITVVPATVVYYEDTFDSINYNKADTTSNNSFTHHGSGSGRLSQSVDQDQPYGQDAAYQDDRNNLYSGQSMTMVQIKDDTKFATFTFKGTGFELIGRTNAFDSASTVARVYKVDKYSETALDDYAAAYKVYQQEYAAYEEALKKYETEGGEMPTAPTAPENPVYKTVPVITQFDHGSDGGKEIINQVPIIRVTDMDYGEYVVELSGIPAYTFDEDYNVTGIADSYVYIDGLRIYQPMGAEHEAYSDKENNASVKELRDLIIDGMIAVGTLTEGALKLSTGTVTWTENLPDNDFDPSNYETYEGIKVDSTGDYLIQGPNNEVYMEGNASNSALVFYVSETADSNVHELQIAVRALDYSKFYGAGSSALDAQLQYGILQSNGTYAWKNLARVVSGTEQYYSIPYTECPVDAQGRYQIVIRAVNAKTNLNALVSYTNVKLNGLSVVKVEGVGETTVMYYQNGMLVTPEYNVVIYDYVDGVVQVVDTKPFTGNELTMTVDGEYAYIGIQRIMNGETVTYLCQTNPGTATTATLYATGGKYTVDVPKGEVTITLKQTTHESLELSYCVHTWDAGEITTEANCTQTGIKTYTCTACGHKKNETLPKNSAHTYSGGTCVRCGVAEPDYYLVGTINGADYGFSADWANPGEYKFVDGKLTATFTDNSYVFIKKGPHADGTYTWYMTQAYVTGSTGTFYDTNTGSAEKMYVTGGVEITFTLVENGDGSLTLSYKLPCDHLWDDGVVNIAPTCTAEGEKEFYCSKCGEVKTETIDMLPHDYQNGICSGCGDIQYTTIYLENTAEWESVYIYTWTAATEDTAEVRYTGDWPGTQMYLTGNLDGNDIYEFSVPVFVNVIFNNGGAGSQTDTLTIPTDGNNMFDNGTNSWKTKGEIVDYYLIGYINGANYGCEEDYANLGDYKFVDGELKATFQTDSYVFIKTTGNKNWYMTQAYVADSTATFHNTSTGATEKMFVPGGVELTFTLVDNGDDTFTLTYHAWTNPETVAATCTENGHITYECGIDGCTETKTEILEATGHEYNDGVCLNCDENETRTVYFRNTAGWETVNIYAWTADGGSEYTANWPGTAMTLVEGETDLYSYELAVNAEAIIFNNGTDQTGNLTAPKDDKVVYHYAAGQWLAVGEEPEITEPTLPETLYLKPNSNWTQASARFAAYFMGTSNTWVDMTDTNGDGIYEVTVPDGDWTTVIFCRMNPATTDNNWDNKWNQTGDLTIPTDGKNLCTIPDDQWDCGTSVTWSYLCTAEHTYQSVVTAPTCTAAGYTTYTCSTCGYSYTGDETAMLDHTYVDGTCSGCGAAEVVTLPETLYLKPNSNWTQASARFAAYFMGTSTTWVDMADTNGDGIYEVTVPDGYTGVIFCRMDPSNTTNDWSAKWNQTGDLTIPTDGTNLCTIPDDQWDCGTSVTWSTYTATASYSLQVARSMEQALSAAVYEEETVAQSETPDVYIANYNGDALNLFSINRQMSSDVIYGEMDPFVPGEDTDTEEQIKINSASLVLSDDISVLYKATVSADCTDAYMVFEFNGVKTTVTEYTVDESGRYCFAFTGVKPQKMGDNISATLYATVAGEEISVSVAQYSVLTYCVNQLGKDISDEFRVLISDLLVYGAKAQVYTDYKTDALVTEGLDLASSTFPGLDAGDNALAFEGEYDANNRFTSAGLNLNNKVVLRLGVAVQDPENCTFELTINGVTEKYTAEDLAYENGKCYLYYDNFKATAFGDTISAVILCNGVQVGQTLEYSVNTYIYKNQNTGDAELRDMLHAIYNYGESAKRYIAAQQ